MNIMIVSIVVFASVFGIAISRNANIDQSFDVKKELSSENLLKLNAILAKELNLLQDIESINYKVLINAYLDKVLANAKIFIIENGYDPTSLPDQRVNVGVGHSDLSQGQLNDTSSLERYQDAVLTYDTDSNKLMAEMDIRFQDLKFIYKYHTKITFISMTGHLHGDVEHVHVYVKLGFDLTENRVFVDTINFKHTGSISLKFSGNALIDWVTNAMSKVLTTLLHSLILNVIKSSISGPLEWAVDAINHMLHPYSVI